MTKNNKKFLLVLSSFSIFIIAIGLVTFVFGYQFLKTGVSDNKSEVIFDVGPNQSFSMVADHLEENQLIKNKWLFVKYAQFKGAQSKLKVGEYSLNQTMTPDQIIAVIISGKSVARKITVIEGANIFDIAELIEKNKIASKTEFLELVKNKVFIEKVLGEKLPSLEGYLFPETYQFTKFDKLEDVVSQMVKRFLKNWSQYEAEAKLRVNTQNWSRNKIITFASIVEKETGYEKDRPLVSSVFHNRLSKNMKLQTDPTVLYGLSMEQNRNVKNITKADLLRPTKYNSYTNFGLPPTPISNPGKNAIESTLNPMTSKYLYFVSRNDGTTAFSESLDQHNSAVKSFQQNAKSRDGKSWRDLKKDK